MTGNALKDYSDLVGLAALPKLNSLCLLENPVVKQDNYRLHVIHMIPQVTVLDFNKVKKKVRSFSGYAAISR